jgi:hypothetical protein
MSWILATDTEHQMKPVFIGGCGRSGTTLLGSLLGAHSECIVTPESQFKIESLRLLAGSEDTGLAEILEMIRSHSRFKLWDVRVDPAEGLQRASDLGSLLVWFVQKYAQSRGKPHASFWVDHTGANSKYAPSMLELYPEARFIHLVRDGRGVAASVMPLDWGPNSVHLAAHWWTEQVAYGLASELYLGPRAMRMTFEELVSSPEASLRRLCDFLELTFEPGMIHADGFDVPSFTRSQHQLVGEPPDPTRAECWKHDLTQREIEVFESLTGDLLVALGYELQFGSHARPVRWIERTRAYGAEALRGLFTNRLRHRMRLRKSISTDSKQQHQPAELVGSDSTSNW